jgi:hypothetical protein
MAVEIQATAALEVGTTGGSSTRLPTLLVWRTNILGYVLLIGRPVKF